MNEDAGLDAMMEDRISGFSGFEHPFEEEYAEEYEGDEEEDCDDSDHEGFSPYAGCCIDDDPIDPYECECEAYD